MGVYSNMLTDEKILSLVGNLKSVVILGCEGCANISVAYDRDIPMGKIIVDANTGRNKTVPTAILVEANRLKSLLEAQGLDVRVETRSGLCNMSDETSGDDLGLTKACADLDGVLLLSCPAGSVGVRKRAGKNVKILPAMKTVGVFQRYLTTDNQKGLVFVDRNKSAMIRILGASEAS
jgi:hypothetical protein